MCQYRTVEQTSHRTCVRFMFHDCELVRFSERCFLFKFEGLGICKVSGSEIMQLQQGDNKNVQILAQDYIDKTTKSSSSDSTTERTKIEFFGKAQLKRPLSVV